jgi:pyruvate carboxylase subunit B
MARRGVARGRWTLDVDGQRIEADALDERTRAIRDLTAAAAETHAGIACVGWGAGVVGGAGAAARASGRRTAPVASASASEGTRPERVTVGATIGRCVTVEGDGASGSGSTTVPHDDGRGTSSVAGCIVPPAVMPRAPPPP